MSARQRKHLDEQINFARSHEITRLLENSARTWRIFHHRRRVTHNGGLFTLPRNTKPDALVAIDRQYYNVAYPFNVITYGIFPVGAVDEREVAGMRLSTTLTCVAEQVIKHFESSQRGAVLTAARRATITAWNKFILERGTGATKQDIAVLEKKIKSSNRGKNASTENIL